MTGAQCDVTAQCTVEFKSDRTGLYTIFVDSSSEAGETYINMFAFYFNDEISSRAVCSS